MNEKIAHRNVGVAEVGAENRFAEEIHEFATRRVTTEKGAALVARAVELLHAGFHISAQAAEKGRQDLYFVAARSIKKLANEKIFVGRVVIDNTHHAADQFVRNIAAALDPNENRNAEPVGGNAVKFAVLGILNRHENNARFGHFRVAQTHNGAVLGEISERNAVAHGNSKLLHRWCFRLNASHAGRSANLPEKTGPFLKKEAPFRFMERRLPVC